MLQPSSQSNSLSETQIKDIQKHLFQVLDYQPELPKSEKLDSLEAPDKLAPFLELTQLKPCSTQSNLQDLLRQALEHSVYGICVHPNNLAFVSDFLKQKDSGIKLITVADFPLGSKPTAMRAHEVGLLDQLSCDEIDVVMQMKPFLMQAWDQSLEDLRAVRAASSKKLKLIIETAYLSETQIVQATSLAQIAEFDCVKTSTGFADRGATIEDIYLIKKSLWKQNVEIKASGGIRSRTQSRELILAGATKLGASQITAIHNEKNKVGA